MRANGYRERMEKGWTWKVYKLKDVWSDKWMGRREEEREGGRKDGKMKRRKGGWKDGKEEGKRGRRKEGWWEGAHADTWGDTRFHFTHLPSALSALTALPPSCLHHRASP